MTLEALRRQMSAVTARHDADAAAAARAFWDEVADTFAESAPDRAGDDAAQGDADGRSARDGPAGGRGSDRGRTARVGFGRDRTRFGRTGCRADGSRPAPGRGPWWRVPTAREGAPVSVVPAETVRDAETRSLFDDPSPTEASRAERESDWAAREADWAAREADWARSEDRGDLTNLRVDAGLGFPLHGHRGSDVHTVAEQVAAARGTADVQLVTLLADLERRDLPAPDGLSRTDWLRSLAPGLTGAQAKAFATVARAMTDPAWRDLTARVHLQQVTVPAAAAILDFHTRVAPAADPDDLQVALTDLTQQAPTLTLEALHRLARHHTEQVRPPRDEDRLDAGRKASRELWFGQPATNGMVSFRGRLDPEGAAIVKSAIDALARPRPDTDEHGSTIAPDPRTPATRRADALVDLISRAVQAAAGTPVTDKAKVVVTMHWDSLIGQVVGTGMTMTGDILSAETVRRMACDAAIIPTVLGSDGELLDLGRERRLVTPALRLALWQRDGGCTFPGCTVPATWCDAHHVTHWCRGGTTSLLNAALLCSRHHDHVHRYDLTATVTAFGVTWHL